jgi:hypothetical protein
MTAISSIVKPKEVALGDFVRCVRRLVAAFFMALVPREPDLESEIGLSEQVTCSSASS